MYALYMFFIRKECKPAVQIKDCQRDGIEFISHELKFSQESIDNFLSA